jgi:hypothetical protein
MPSSRPISLGRRQNQTKPYQPNQTKINQIKPNQTEPNKQTETDQTKINQQIHKRKGSYNLFFYVKQQINFCKAF